MLERTPHLTRRERRVLLLLVEEPLSASGIGDNDALFCVLNQFNPPLVVLNSEFKYELTERGKRVLENTYLDGKPKGATTNA